MVYKAIRIANGDMRPHRFCDICNDEINISSLLSSTQCRCCGKDLCKKHIIHKEYTFDEDCVVYCEKCWNIGKQYRPIIDELSNKKDQLYKEWHDKCNEDNIE